MTNYTPKYTIIVVFANSSGMTSQVLSFDSKQFADAAADALNYKANGGIYSHVFKAYV